MTENRTVQQSQADVSYFFDTLVRTISLLANILQRFSISLFPNGKLWLFLSARRISQNSDKLLLPVNLGFRCGRSS